MKIALLGYGKMGRMVEALAPRHKVEIVAHFNSAHPLRADDANRQTLAETEVLVDFSAPGAVLENIHAAAALSRNIVVGTTGWHDQLEEAKKLVAQAGTGLVHGSNFSLGVNLFYQVAEHAARLFSAFDGYDAFLEEAHHKFKKDAPSGTALVLQKLLTQALNERPVPVTSVRAGYVPGTHAVSFDSSHDTIRLEHTARNREGFAEGALLAAKWIAGRKGFYEFREVVAQSAARLAQESSPE